MKRCITSPRRSWASRVEEKGFVYHTNYDGSSYWDESVYFEFSLSEIEKLEKAAFELHQLFLEASQWVLDHEQLDLLNIPKKLHPLIYKSWSEDQWELYGRFDFAFDGQVPKLLEYNADTPSGLLEASIIQWDWKESCFPENDQFNRIHEKLVTRWKELAFMQLNQSQPLYLSSIQGHVEDRMTVGYLGETAEQAGFQTRYIPMEQIGWNKKKRHFVDDRNLTIGQMFKLYPWEWMAYEDFGNYLDSGSVFVEPAWKAIFASKALLTILQKLNPGHPNLLEVSKEPLRGPYVKKPIFGREGHNITINNRELSEETEGHYGVEGYIYQEFQPLFMQDGFHAQVGVWMVGPEPVGMGIREDKNSILTNTSRFIPHIIDK